MFTIGKKKNVIGTYFDTKGKEYHLVKEQKSGLLNKKKTWDEVYFFSPSDKEKIEAWNVHLLNIDLMKSTPEDIEIYIEEYLKTSTNINSALQKSQFPFKTIQKLWNDNLKDKGFVQSTILVHQKLAHEEDFILNLNFQEKWLFLTQNEYRTKDNMTPYTDVFEEVIVDYMNKFLSKRKLEKYEQIMGIWRTLILETLDKYCPSIPKERITEKALALSQSDLKDAKEELIQVQSEIKLLDKKYEESSLSERYKIEEEMKKMLEKEAQLKENVQIEVDKEAFIHNYLFIPR